ncbi:MAG: ATP-binding protein [Treponema sp.]
MRGEKVIDLLFTKYLKAVISYEGVTRIETYPYPKAAIREAVYNAIVHKNYAAQIPIQIGVYRDKLYISNDCMLPAGWTVETLMHKHRSKPFNPTIANGFFRAGLIETWGRGIEKICEACREYHNPLPEYTVYPEEITVMFKCREWENTTIMHEATYNREYEYRHNTDTNTDTNTDILDNKAITNKVLEFLQSDPEATQKEISRKLGITSRTVERAISVLKKEHRIKRSGNNRSGFWIIIDEKNIGAGDHKAAHSIKNSSQRK